VESHEDRQRAIRDGDPPPVGDPRPSSSQPDRGAPNIDRDFSKSTVWNAGDRDFRKITVWNDASRIGLAVVAMSLLVSCLVAPYLFPFFQLLLVPPVLVAAVVGSVGGLCRAWWLTGLLWVSLLALAHWYESETKHDLDKAMYPDLVEGQPVPDYYYIETWGPTKVYWVTVIPLTLGVAVLIHGWIAKRGRRREEAKVVASLRVGLGVGALLGGVGGAAFEALPAVCKGSTPHAMEVLVFAAFGMPAGAAVGGLTGAIVGILRKNCSFRDILTVRLPG
jgi:hypothetical protein